ncbi:MAG: YitT family protein [Prevotellaceae bacterium]|nr:YitT family protein [Prevotellaceae bacterium]
MQKLTPEKLFSKKWFIAYSLILLGSFVMASGFVFFVSPYKLAPGGVYGISITLHYVYEMYHLAIQGLLGNWIPDNLEISIVAICMDIPLCLLGIKALGPIFGVKTVVGFSSLAFFTYLLENTWGYNPLVDDPMLSAIFGGVLIGLGVGLMFKAKATSGGTDIISMILSKKLHIPVGTMLVIVDSIVVMVTLAAFKDWKIPLYSWLVIYITGQIVNATLYGFRRIKTMLIVSDKHEDIARYILGLDRGGTLFYGEGIYTGNAKKIIFTNVNIKEVNLIYDYIREIDPQAFVTVMDANEVTGEGRGFRNIHESSH